jgi:hypothetical protein
MSSFKVSGLVWDSIVKPNGRPVVIGIEGAMVSVFVTLDRRDDCELRVTVSVCRVTGSGEATKLLSGDVLKGKLVKPPEGNLKDFCYGELEVVN